MTKVCKVCGIEKDLEEFYKAKTGKYGRNSRCKECAKKILEEKRSKVIPKDGNSCMLSVEYASTVLKDCTRSYKGSIEHTNPTAIVELGYDHVPTVKEFKNDVKKIGSTLHLRDRRLSSICLRSIDIKEMNGEWLYVYEISQHVKYGVERERTLEDIITEIKEVEEVEEVEAVDDIKEMSIEEYRQMIMAEIGESYE